MKAVVGAAPAACVPAPAAAPPTLVLVHGWGSRHEVFAPFVAALGGGFEIVALDLPAHGAAVEEPFPRDIEAMLGWMRRRIPRGAVLVGWSLGGVLGLRFAQAFPGHLAALVTIATSPCFLQREGWQAGMDDSAFAGFRDGLPKVPG
jgi:pimeloyl-[acyl-carrier protein] methyl ester esterase